MSHLQYYSYEKDGVRKRDAYGYQSAVRIGDEIKCSGQGGWDDDTGKIFRDTRKQVETAFANIELMLKAAGGKGWSQVYSVTSYHVPLNGEVLEIMGEQFKKWMPDHKPIWSTVGVPRLGEDDLRTEIVVTAHDPEGAAAARKAAHHGRS